MPYYALGLVLGTGENETNRSKSLFKDLVVQWSRQAGDHTNYQIVTTTREGALIREFQEVFLEEVKSKLAFEG